MTSSYPDNSLEDLKWTFSSEHLCDGRIDQKVIALVLVFAFSMTKKMDHMFCLFVGSTNCCISAPLCRKGSALALLQNRSTLTFLSFVNLIEKTYLSRCMDSCLCKKQPLNRFFVGWFTLVMHCKITWVSGYPKGIWSPLSRRILAKADTAVGEWSIQIYSMIVEMRSKVSHNAHFRVSIPSIGDDSRKVYTLILLLSPQVPSHQNKFFDRWPPQILSKNQGFCHFWRHFGTFHIPIHSVGGFNFPSVWGFGGCRPWRSVGSAADSRGRNPKGEPQLPRVGVFNEGEADKFTKEARFPTNSKLGGGFKYFLFSPRSLGKWSNLTNIFQMGWNHQPVNWVSNFELDLLRRGGPVGWGRSLEKTSKHSFCW